MQTPFLNHKACDTEREAHEYSDQLIGGAVIQLQDDGKWHAFGAREFAEKVAAGEYDNWQRKAA